MKKVFNLRYFRCDVIIRNTSLRKNFDYAIVKKLLKAMENLILHEKALNSRTLVEFFSGGYLYLNNSVKYSEMIDVYLKR